MIELKEVRKSYNGIIVFENANLIFKEGTVTAFVGHNGCGKSTMLKVVSGLAKKDCGSITYDAKYRFAYVPEKFPAVNMSSGAYLMHMAEIDMIHDKKESANIINALAREFYVNDMLDKPMKNLSKGTLQKIGVIQALMCKPDVLLLDEPLSGQDADSQEIFIDKIKNLKKQGVIILLSAHEPDLINSLADRIYTISEQKVLEYDNKPQSLYIIQVSENDKSITTNEQLLSFEIRHFLLMETKRQ